METVFLTEGEVKVTNTRFIMPGQTYAVADITSVRFETISPKLKLPGWIVIVGILLVFFHDIHVRILGAFLVIGGTCQRF
jgi:hypothetical protein